MSDPVPEEDPLAGQDDVAISADGDPIIARDAGSVSPVLIAAAFGLLAILLFVWLNGRRMEQTRALAPSEAVAAAAWSPPPPLEMPATQISTTGPGPFSGLPTQVLPSPPPAPPAQLAPVSGYANPAPPVVDMTQRRRAPALVVDLGAGPGERLLAQADVPPGAALGAAAGAGAAAGPQAAGGSEGGQRPRLSETEQFAQRVGDEAPERARATPMRNPGAMIAQGAVIPGVLESAINSDLPGFTRAIVSRDVMSFDGRAVLIPRGSRLIGQYKSAVALGQSRAFIIWTRVIRPDGVSVQIGSPGTDELGRGGLDGSVDRHFFRRFSGSILLSVLNAAVASVGQTPATQISIGSPGAAFGAASAATQGEAIPPTIKVRQGEAINIFVARDLDFSGVERVR